MQQNRFSLGKKEFRQNINTTRKTCFAKPLFAKGGASAARTLISRLLQTFDLEVLFQYLLETSDPEMLLYHKISKICF